LTVRAVIFDLGHTIWDIPSGEESWRLAIERMFRRLLQDRAGAKASSARELGQAIGFATREWEARYAGDEPLSQPPSTYFIEEALRSLGVTATSDLIDELTETLFGSELAVRTVEQDTRDTLALLRKKGLSLGCVTNTLLLEKGILDLLQMLGLRSLFESVVVSSEIGFRKPHPSLFMRALDELKVTANRAVFVGDSLRNDVAGAKGVGMLAVLTRQYRQERFDGPDPAPDAVVERLSELPNLALFDNHLS
jgi:HAD superfamily hydrolase (TIGR01509 family)